MAASEDRHICSSAVTIDHVQECILNTLALIESGAKIVSFGAKEIGEGKGFVSVMACVTLEWNMQHSELPQTVIAKIPILKNLDLWSGGDETKQAMVKVFKQQAFKHHNSEVSAYRVFWAQSAPLPVPLPKLYGLRGLETEHSVSEGAPAYILMQDMTSHCDTVNYMTGGTLSDTQLRQVMCAIADYHVWSLLHPQEVAKLSCTGLAEYFEKTFDQFTTQFDNLVKLMQDDKEWAAFIGPELIGDIQVLKLSLDQLRGLEVVHREGNVPDMLRHGDIHTNNMLFALDGNGQPTGDLMAIIDWQTFKIGNGLVDLSRALLFPIPLAQRTQQYREQMLQAYYQRFCERLGNVPCPFTFTQLVQAFWRTFMTDIQQFVPMMPGVVNAIKQGKMTGTEPEAHSLNMRENMKSMWTDVRSLIHKYNKTHN